MSVLTTLIQAIFARLYAIQPEGKWGKQKGASALEYIVLAAVIVIAVALGALVFGGTDGVIADTFEDIRCALDSECDPGA